MSQSVRPTVRVVVVTFASADLVTPFVESVRKASVYPVAITVVDNASSDDTVDLVSERSDIDLLEAGDNLGFGRAANLGVRKAGEDWVVVANPDVVFQPGSIDELLSVAARWPGAGVLGPRIHTIDGRLYPSARELPSLGRGVGHALFGWVWPANPWTAAYRRERERPREGVTGWLSGACLFLRRQAFDAVGGFDESYFMYFEDTDLCERLAAAGWTVVYAPSALVEHVGGHSTSQNLTRMSKAHHDSAYRYLSRRYAGPANAPLRAVLKAGLWGRYQLSRRVGRVVHGAQPTRRA